MRTEDTTPNPEYLIKSIAEQGYSLETSISDLIDNSITAQAKRIEILADITKTPFKLIISDDGNGMSETELIKNMKFPSSSPEERRNQLDLGRFGLGMKTASFAQTRCFTVLSRKRGESEYSARTWDIEHLKNSGWQVIVNSDGEIDNLLNFYNELRQGFNNPFDQFSPNTIIFWNGLYKFENNPLFENQSEILQSELNETTKNHLQLIFHRFMERKEPLKIKLNNADLIPFNPFPEKARPLSSKRKMLVNSRLSMEGFVLPSRSISESKGISEWTLPGKSLMDMEGMYIYRADRIIDYGGWNGVIKKSPRLQLARLKVEIGNGADQLFHLNVAKSSIIIPFGERYSFTKYVAELKQEAEKEYYNLVVGKPLVKSEKESIFKRIPTKDGISLDINQEFPIIKNLMATLEKAQIQQLKIILRMVFTGLNKIKKVHNDDNFNVLVQRDQIEEDSIVESVKLLMQSGITKEAICSDFLPYLGISSESIPETIKSILK